MKFILLFPLAIAVFIILVLILESVLPKKSIPSLSNKDHYIKVLDTNIRYRIYDNGGPYIILLHSFGGNLNLWEPVAKRIKCGRIITLDLIGFGMSVSDVENFSLDSHSRYLIAFMDALDINSACLVGSSMGASIAAWTASKRPERVNRVVLFAPSGFPGSMRHTWPLDLIYRPGILNRFIDAIAKSSIFKFFFPQSLAQQALEVTASYDFSFVEALMKIKQPVDLVWSPEDKRVSFLYVQDYRKLISQATLYMASAGSGHEAAFLEPNFSARLIANGIED